VLSGCASYAAAAERLASRMTVAACGDEADDAEGPLPQPAAHAITSAAAMLEALMGLAASAGTPPALLAMARTLQLHVVAAAHDEPELVARDLSALAALEAALSRLAAPYPPLADVVEALAAVACGGPRGEQVVDVLDVLDARAIRWRHVFAIGLTDRGFPRPQPAGALLTEGERLAWSRRGLAVDCTADLAAREMLLFYLAATRADVSLTLSLAGSDASGKSLAISPFVLDLLRPLGGIEAMQARGAVQHVPAGEFLRPPGQMASSREAVLALATLLGATEGPPAWKPAAVALAQSPLVARWLCRGSWARRRRWSAGPCDEFDGRLSHPSLLASLNDHTSGHIFSASQFNTFLRCPWAYFGRYVLGLEPLDEPTRRLEPIARGIFVHDVLRRIMEKLRGSAPDVALWSVPAVDVAAAMDAAIHAAAATVHAPYPALWEVQLAEIRRQIETYLNWQREAWAALKARSRHFELAFGVESTDGCDPRSTTQPVELTTAAGPIRVQGRIDRIDHVCLDELAGLMVVDYKTGALPSAKDISAAMDVQIGLYALAAEKLLAPALGGALHRVADRPGERLYGDIARQRGGGYSPATSDPPPREKLLTRLAEVVSAIRAGRFDLMPQRCISHCPLRQICHYSQARADRKQSLDGQPSAPLAPGKEAGDE
jgi:RecB family exonuclease